MGEYMTSQTKFPRTNIGDFLFTVTGDSVKFSLDFPTSGRVKFCVKSKHYVRL